MYHNGGFVPDPQCGFTVGNEDLNGPEYQDGVGLPVMVVIFSIYPKPILGFVPKLYSTANRRYR